MSDENTAEEQPGADASPDTVDTYVDTSVDTSLEATPELSLEEVETISEQDSEPEPEESEAESPPAGEEQAEEKTNDPFKKRIDKLTASWRETQRALQQRESELAELQQRLDQVPRPQEPMKTLADFDYNEAGFNEYIMGRAADLAREEARAAVAQQQRETQATTQESEYKKRESTFAEEHKDFHELVYDRSLAISGTMAEVIHLTEEGPELAYHLAKNPARAADIAAMSPTLAAMEMAELRAELRAEKAKSSKKVSDAPPPPKPIRGGDPGSPKDPAKMSDKEFAKWRRNQIAQR